MLRRQLASLRHQFPSQGEEREHEPFCIVLLTQPDACLDKQKKVFEFFLVVFENLGGKIKVECSEVQFS